MFEFFQKLRTKSEDARARFAFGASIAITVFVVGLWYITPSEVVEQNAPAEVVEAVPGETVPVKVTPVEANKVSPLSTIGEAFDEIWGVINGVKGAGSSILSGGRVEYVKPPAPLAK